MMKYTKRISALMCAVLLMLCTSVSVFALTDYKLIDDANLFTSAETTEINQALADLNTKTDWSVIVYTNTRGVSSSRMEDTYNDYYDEQNYGKDGVLFVIDRGQDNRIIITKGDAMYYFSDRRMDEIKSKLKPYLDKEDWYGATMKFIDCTEDYFDSGKDKGASYSNVKLEENAFVYVLKHWSIPIAILALGVAALSVVFVALRYKHNGKSGTYDLRANSTTKILDRQDVFLTKSVSVTTIQSSSSSGHSSGGGRSGGSSHGSSGSF